MKRLPIEDLEHIYHNTQDIWESFRGKSIFVTGGTGFFGKWLLESFIYSNEKLALNAKITTLTRNPEAFLMEYPFYKEHTNTVQFVKGDILNYDFNLEEKFQFIIHAATAASESLNKSNPLLMMDTITIGTRKVLDFAITQPLQGFLFVSSGAIYGKQPWNQTHINENDCFKININNSNSAYAEGKRIAELYSSTYFEKYNVPIKIARCFAFVGPYLPLNTHFAIGNFINNAINNEDIFIKGDGSTIRSYMYASDLMIWLWKILLKGEINQPYNVGSDEGISIKQLAEKISSISNAKVAVKIVGSPVQKEQVDIYCPSITKANTINAQMKIQLTESIEKTIKFMNHTNRSCPICHSKNSSLIKKINFSLFEGHPMQGGYDLVQCQDCSFIYADTKITQVELDNYYSNLSKYESKEISTGGGYNDYDRNRLIDTAKYISSQFEDKSLAIADVGCAIGGLLEQLKNEGFNNITGIDPSISCVNITKNEKGINCLHASLFELNESFGKYDLVILSHVWEHILDLEVALKSIEKILKPNGCIYVECPNAMNYKNFIHAPYQEFNTEHINHFSSGSFYNFFGSRAYSLIDSGIRIMKIASSNDYDAVYSLFRKNISGAKSEINYDHEILPSIKQYLKVSDNAYIQILDQIKKVAAQEDDIAFVGIGQFAFKLLESVKELGIKNKLILFDNNTLNQGKIINDSIVYSGKNLISNYKSKKFNIIITSLIYQNEIANNLKAEFEKNSIDAPLICKLS